MQCAVQECCSEESCLDFRHPITIEGMYKICFDNTFSHFSVKTVAFGISMENEDEAHWSQDADIDFQPEGNYDVTISEIQVISLYTSCREDKVPSASQDYCKQRDFICVPGNYK